MQSDRMLPYAIKIADSTMQVRMHHSMDSLRAIMIAATLAGANKYKNNNE
jgi:hypothetical protein